MKPIFAILFSILSIVLVACGDDSNTSTGDTSVTERDARLTRPLGDRTVLGTAAYIDPMPWAPIYAQDIINGQLDVLLASASNDIGQFRILGLFNQHGLLQTEPAFPGSTPLFSFYRMSAFGTSSRSNINPVTDVVVRSYLWRLRSTTPEACFYDLACARDLAAGLDNSLITSITQQLRQTLAAAWRPETSYDPFTALFETGDAADLMLTNTRFQVEPETDDQDNVTRMLLRICSIDLNSQEVIVDLLDFSAIDNDEPVQTPPCINSPMPAQPFEIMVTATPARGNIPLSTNINISLGGAIAQNAEILTIEAALLNPRGQPLAFWDTLDFAAELRQVGQHRVFVYAVADGIRAQGGTTISVDGIAPDPALATWGSDGSWRKRFDHWQSLNQCYELLDGSRQATPLALSVQDVIVDPGICARTVQFDYPLLGWCSFFANETRVYFYQTEQLTVIQRLSREAQQGIHRAYCEDEVRNGTWTNAP